MALRPGEPSLTEVADGIFAYVQPDGSWGWSNAGLVAGAGTSLLVDTLFDLRLTQDMLDAMRGLVAGRPIDAVVNTHANGDHSYGNQLLGDVRIIASDAASREMEELPASRLHLLKGLDLGEDGNRFVAEAFGPFRLDNITATLPNETFTGSHEVTLGDRTVILEEVGPAHTAGDVIVHVPDAGVVFTGDIFFHRSTPIIWTGPVTNWLAACRRIHQLAPTVVVPGHGPVSDLEGVTTVEAYLHWLQREVIARQPTGMTVPEIARDIELGPFADWSDHERLVVNVDAVLAELDPTHQRMNAITALIEMGRYRYGR